MRYMSHPNETELQILKVLWEAGPLSAREIHEHIGPELSWSYSTSRTTLRRMGDKGLLQLSKSHGVQIYSPTESKVRTLSVIMRNFLGTVMEMKGPLPTAAFQDSQLLSEAEWEELSRNLAEDLMQERVMIKALLLTHIASLIIAGAAWIFQRDGKGRIGANFPAPTIWLGLIGFCFLPALLCSFLTAAGSPASVQGMNVFTSVFESAEQNLSPASPLAIWPFLYGAVATLLIVRTLWQWARLQRLPMRPGPAPDVWLTDVSVPPLTLSWPRRRIVLPAPLSHEARIIAHERTHLHHHDAEVTLALLVFKGAFLGNPGFGWLTAQWRQAIELRADRRALIGQSEAQKKSYAELLLSLSKKLSEDPSADPVQPCPTAHLNPKRNRSLKMRLNTIISQEPTPHKTRWSAVILTTALGMSALGWASSAQERPKDTAVKIVKRVAPIMPANCTGLDRSKIKVVTEKHFRQKNQDHTFTAADVGGAIVKFDVMRDGSIENVVVEKSTHACFDTPSLNSTKQWRAEAQATIVRGERAKIKFLLVSEDGDPSLEEQITDFIK